MGKKLTTEEFIARAKDVHGDRYDYSKVVYVDYSTKVEIICKEHGSFWQTPSSHLNKKGCPGCGLKARAKKRKKDIDWFIEKAKEVHGDKYDYSKSVYKGVGEDIEILCPIHGSFWQRAGHHLQGSGCKQCAIIKSAIKQRKQGIEEFISKSIQIHGCFYDYSKVEYVDCKTKVCIICPIHGEFWQAPSYHLMGQGCPMCRYEKVSKKRRSCTDEFFSKAKEVHGDRYNYSLVEYINYHTKVKIICPKHGVFEQTPAIHLRGGGCPKCKAEKASNLYRGDIFNFIEKAHIVHGDKYDYSKVEYINNQTPVCIICPVHGEFWQRPINHLQGQGCHKCSSSHGEVKIEAYLKSNNIEYTTQYHVLLDKKLFSRSKLRVDFYLPDMNTIIEFHGVQHYKEIPFFHRRSDDFARQVDRDRRLCQYCKQHKINLIEIKYDQIDKIDKILDKN